MADDLYLSLTPRERLELLDAASQKRGLAPAILEKDYWVCKTLDMLFALSELGRHLVFKGGTSLSKVYGLIDRFSEDVDVSFHRWQVGAHLGGPVCKARRRVTVNGRTVWV